MTSNASHTRHFCRIASEPMRNSSLKFRMGAFHAASLAAVVVCFAANNGSSTDQRVPSVSIDGRAFPVQGGDGGIFWAEGLDSLAKVTVSLPDTRWTVALLQGLCGEQRKTVLPSATQTAEILLDDENLYQGSRSLRPPNVELDLDLEEVELPCALDIDRSHENITLVLSDTTQPLPNPHIVTEDKVEFKDGRAWIWSTNDHADVSLHQYPAPFQYQVTVESSPCSSTDNPPTIEIGSQTSVLHPEGRAETARIPQATSLRTVDIKISSTDSPPCFLSGDGRTVFFLLRIDPIMGDQE